MSENLQTFTKALHVLRSVGNRVPGDAWDRPTCCSEWTAREVAGHAAWVIRSIGSSAAQTERPAQQAEADVAGDDPGATLRESIDATLAAIDRPDVLHRVTQTPFGEMPMDTFLGSIWVDPLLHAWDIADAVGIDHGIDDATATAARAALEPLAAAIRGPGMFDAEVEPPAGADAAAAFAAFAGRRSVHA